MMVSCSTSGRDEHIHPDARENHIFMVFLVKIQTQMYLVLIKTVIRKNYTILKTVRG